MGDDYRIEVLGEHHVNQIRSFTCTGDYTAELVEFIRTEALSEHAHALSTSFVVFSEDDKEIDAYVTLSATSIKMSESARSRLQAGRSRPQIPAVMMDYIAISDGGRSRRGRGFGLALFEWVKQRVHQVNATAGVRIIGLEVRAGNWRAYQRYSSPEWGFRPLYLQENKAKEWPGMQAPDARRPSRPPEVHPDRYIKMYYDLVEHYGVYLPPEE